MISGEGVRLAQLTIDIVHEHAVIAQHWSLPEVPIEIVPFTFTEWARGAAAIAVRRQVETVFSDD